jgi:hypothetical protein
VPLQPESVLAATRRAASKHHEERTAEGNGIQQLVRRAGAHRKAGENESFHASPMDSDQLGAAKAAAYAAPIGAGSRDNWLVF